MFTKVYCDTLHKRFGCIVVCCTFSRTLRSYNTVYCTLKSINKSWTLRHHLYCENEETIIFYHVFFFKYIAFVTKNELFDVCRSTGWIFCWNGKFYITVGSWILSTIPYTTRQLIDGLSWLCSVWSDFIRRQWSFILVWRPVCELNFPF